MLNQLALIPPGFQLPDGSFRVLLAGAATELSWPDAFRMLDGLAGLGLAEHQCDLWRLTASAGAYLDEATGGDQLNDPASVTSRVFLARATEVVAAYRRLLPEEAQFLRDLVLTRHDWQGETGYCTAAAAAKATVTSHRRARDMLAVLSNYHLAARRDDCFRLDRVAAEVVSAHRGNRVRGRRYWLRVAGILRSGALSPPFTMTPMTTPEAAPR
jgi:hypothetical protein